MPAGPLRVALAVLTRGVVAAGSVLLAPRLTQRAIFAALPVLGTRGAIRPLCGMTFAAMPVGPLRMPLLVLAFVAVLAAPSVLAAVSLD